MNLSDIRVVVPCRNEELRLASCLQAIDTARSVLRSVQPDVTIEVVVVLDRCTDRSAEIARRWPRVIAVPSDHGQVGAARATGVSQAWTRTTRPDRSWIACTDADSLVPADWLRTQWALAASGADVVLGTVRPDPREITPQDLQVWLDEHDLGDGHEHVHGANLGVRGSWYARVGGFRALPAHEDVELVRRLRAEGARVVSTGRSPVITSARLTGRAPEGMASYLGDLHRRSAAGIVG